LLNQNSHSSFVTGPPRFFPGSLNILRSPTSSGLGNAFEAFEAAGEAAAVDVALTVAGIEIGLRGPCWVSGVLVPVLETGLTVVADEMGVVVAGPADVAVGAGSGPLGAGLAAFAFAPVADGLVAPPALGVVPAISLKVLELESSPCELR
jgi:hypothetical protein